MASPQQSVIGSESEVFLYVALEISESSWLVGSHIRTAKNPRIKKVRTDSIVELLQEIKLAKTRFNLQPETRVLCCYEASYCGFWIARALSEADIQTIVLPPTVLEDYKGGRRRRKTDKLDVKDLLHIFMAYQRGETYRLHPVEVPPELVEDRMRVHRERTRLVKERTAHKNRIRGVLRLIGCKPDWRKTNPIPEGVKGNRLEELNREVARLQLVEKQVKEIEKTQRHILKTATDRCAEVARFLFQIRGIGIQSAWILSYEMLGWRVFKNRRQVGSFPGLVNIPKQSGSERKDGRISKMGSSRLRSLLVEVSWMWLRHQPKSALSDWYKERFSHTRRGRKVGIIGLARKLLIALWRMVTIGVIPDGAMFSKV